MEEIELRASVRRAKRIERAAELHSQGLNLRAISERLGVGLSQVSRDLRAAGVAPRKYERRGEA